MSFFFVAFHSNTEHTFIMDITSEYKDMFSRLVALIRTSNAVNAKDVGFVRSLNRNLALKSEKASSELLELINTLVLKIDPVGASVNGTLDSFSSVNSRWRSIEQTFEIALDKAVNPPQSKNKLAAVNMREIHKQSSSIDKPQLKFAKKVDNSVGPFKPIISEKLFSTSKSFKESTALHKPDEHHPQEYYPQPYEDEIRKAKFPAKANVDFVGPKPDWESTPFTFVNTPKLLNTMIAKLEKATEIAVDVEHHEYRTYLGLTCLVQISALGEDYIVDSLALRSEMQSLNRVFANPNIVKILHGARMDVLWLQRDLGIYLVNLLDTFVASQLLGLPKHSLAYLLQRYANFEAQKQYQLADWRIRPLPSNLVDYARADTHYLIYVYQQMRHDLIKRNLWKQAIANSKDIAVKKYEKPGWNLTEPAWLATALKYRLNGDQQRSCLACLWEWRDNKAREHDESPRYVMTPQFIANLCVSQPTTTAGVLNASHSISGIARDSLAEIVAVIQKALTPESIAAVNEQFFAKNKTKAELREAKLKVKAETEVPKMLSTSKVFFDVEATKYERPEIDLRIIKPECLQRAQSLQEKSEELSENEEENDENEGENDEVKESDEIKEENKESEMVVDEKPVKGRKLDIVSNFDNYDVSEKIQNKKSKKTKLEKTEAFDFEAAARAVDQQTSKPESKSFTPFRAGGKVSKSNSSKFKKARSFRK